VFRRAILTHEKRREPGRGCDDGSDVVWALFWFLGRGCPVRKGASLARLLHGLSATKASAKRCEHANRHSRTPATVSCGASDPHVSFTPPGVRSGLEFSLAHPRSWRTVRRQPLSLEPSDSANPWHAVAHSFLTAHDGSFQLRDVAGPDGAVGACSNVRVSVMKE
jgi:hypothetical protein